MPDENPQAGDIMIHREVHSPAVYILSRQGGPLEISFETYDQALAKATAFASKESLDAWYTTDERIFKRVAQHRPTKRPY